MIARRLLSDRRGATATEFALLAPTFVVFLFLIVEGARLTWVHQSLAEVAFSTVRCNTIETTRCGTATLAKDYAVARARNQGVGIATSAVTLTSNTTCRGNAASNQITITTPFNSPVRKLITAIPANVTATACFPTL